MAARMMYVRTMAMKSAWKRDPKASALLSLSPPSATLYPSGISILSPFAVIIVSYSESVPVPMFAVTSMSRVRFFRLISDSPAADTTSPRRLAGTTPLGRGDHHLGKRVLVLTVDAGKPHPDVVFLPFSRKTEGTSPSNDVLRAE